MPSRLCLGGCGQFIPATPGKPRCPTCTQAKRAERPITYTEQQRRAEAVQAWVADHGHTCPGWHRPPHAATDLTADHVIPFAVTHDETSELTVLCRSCNSAKRDRLD